VLLPVTRFWLQPDGLLGQLHAANLLGALQVVIEAAVADVTRMIEQQPDANLRVSGTCMVTDCADVTSMSCWHDVSRSWPCLPRLACDPVQDHMWVAFF
jgi:hypothetical protein